MAVTQYRGSRYVPLFDGEWDATKEYEPLTVVMHEGNSFTSRQAVTAGVELTDTDFWLETGNYNAQIEAYRREVLDLERRVRELEERVING